MAGKLAVVSKTGESARDRIRAIASRASGQSKTIEVAGFGPVKFVRPTYGATTPIIDGAMDAELEIDKGFIRFVGLASMAHDAGTGELIWQGTPDDYQEFLTCPSDLANNFMAAATEFASSLEADKPQKKTRSRRARG